MLAAGKTWVSFDESLVCRPSVASSASRQTLVRFYRTAVIIIKLAQNTIIIIIIIIMWVITEVCCSLCFPSLPRSRC